MPKALSDDKRAAILVDIQAGEKSAGRIARDHGVAVSTVTRLAKGAGVDGAFERSQTEKATRAKVIDCRAAREQLKRDLLEDAQRLRARAWAPYQVVVSTPQGADVVTLDEPPLAEVRSAYTALGIAIDKSLVLEKHDQVETTSDATSMLDALADGIRAYSSSLSGEPAAPERGE